MVSYQVMVFVVLQKNRPQIYSFLGNPSQYAQYVGLILSKRECSNNSVMDICPL